MRSAMRPTFVVARNELALLRRDPLPLVLLFLVPLAFVGFLKPAMFVTLIIEGYPDANGAEQAVPGAAATFSMFFTGYIGLAFFRDHAWGTWDRLRASGLRPLQIIAGKLLPCAMVSGAQLALLFGAGALLFSLDVKGSLLAVAAVSLAVTLSHLAVGMALVSFARTPQQVNAIANLGAAAFAGIGGAVVPLYLLPQWVGVIGAATPTYWAMRGYRSVILDGSDLGGVVIPLLALLGFTLALGVIAARRFRFDERKLAWS